MSRLEVHLEPLEPLLFGDNRSARAGTDHALADQDPSPATIYGAIGGALARSQGVTGEMSWSAAEAFLGPFRLELEGGPKQRAQLLGYVRCDHDPDHPWFPRPEHLCVSRLSDGSFAAAELLCPGPRPDCDEGVLSSLPVQRRLRGPSAPDDLREAEEELWIDEELLIAVLTSAEVSEDGRIAPRERFERAEHRFGVGMRNRTNTAEEGLLFNRPYRRFASGVSAGGEWSSAGYRAWYELLTPLPAVSGSSVLGFFGGDRGRARLRFETLAEEPLATLRRSVLAAGVEPSGGFLCYLLTPMVKQVGLPEAGGAKPCAAAIGRPFHVSGWRGAAANYGPRRIRTLLPAGSVFFYEWPDGCDSDRDRRRLLEDRWLEPIDESYRHAGFGRTLPGVWRSR